jgi:hypothetical protein
MGYFIIQRVHCAGLLDAQNISSADTGISRQTESHSFGDHLISGSVSITPSSVIKVSIVLCSVSSWLVWVIVQSACALKTRYINIRQTLQACETFRNILEFTVRGCRHPLLVLQSGDHSLWAIRGYLYNISAASFIRVNSSILNLGTRHVLVRWRIISNM